MEVNPVSRPYEWTFRRVVWATVVIAFVAFCFWLLYRFYEVVFILFVAIVTGTVIRPISNWVQQRGIPKPLSVILIYLLLLVLIAGFLWLLFPLISEQASTIARELPGYYQNLRGALINSPNQLIARWGALLPVGLPGFNLVQPTGQDVVASAEQIWQYLLATAQVIFTVIAILVLTFY